MCHFKISFFIFFFFALVTCAMGPKLFHSRNNIFEIGENWGIHFSLHWHIVRVSIVSSFRNCNHYCRLLSLWFIVLALCLFRNCNVIRNRWKVEYLIRSCFVCIDANTKIRIMCKVTKTLLHSNIR